MIIFLTMWYELKPLVLNCVFSSSVVFFTQLHRRGTEVRQTDRESLISCFFPPDRYCPILFSKCNVWFYFESLHLGLYLRERRVDTAMFSSSVVYCPPASPAGLHYEQQYYSPSHRQTGPLWDQRTASVFPSHRQDRLRRSVSNTILNTCRTHTKVGVNLISVPAISESKPNSNSKFSSLKSIEENCNWNVSVLPELTRI